MVERYINVYVRRCGRGREEEKRMKKGEKEDRYKRERVGDVMNSLILLPFRPCSHRLNRKVRKRLSCSLFLPQLLFFG